MLPDSGPEEGVEDNATTLCPPGAQFRNIEPVSALGDMPISEQAHYLLLGSMTFEKEGEGIESAGDDTLMQGGDA